MRLDACSRDALTEIVSIGVGYSAGVLESMLDCHIHLRIPRVEVLRAEELSAHLGVPASSVHLGFTGYLMGDAVMLFPPQAALRLAALLNQEEPASPEPDFLCGSTLTELGNLLLNGIVGTISNLLQLQLDYRLPQYTELPLEQWLGRREATSAVLLVRSIISLEDHPIEGELILCLDSVSAQQFLDRIKN